MDWKGRSSVVLKFYDAKSRLIDAYTLQLGEPPIAESTGNSTGRPVKVVDQDGRMTVSAGSVQYHFDKASGLLESVQCAGPPCNARPATPWCSILASASGEITTKGFTRVKTEASAEIKL
jgi:hypothetical protein